jgi:hypothetical protein
LATGGEEKIETQQKLADTASFFILFLIFASAA